MINFKFNLARFMCQLKKTIKVITYFGLIPFYLPRFIEYLNFNLSTIIFKDVDNFSYLYCALIIAFLSGMQWHKIILMGEKKYILVPILPLFLALSINYNFVYFDPFVILIFSLIFSLSIDLIILRYINQTWFKKLRINATFLACISFLL